MKRCDLVIQGETPSSADVQLLSQLCGASVIDRMTAQAFRLRSADPAQKAQVAAHCGAAQLDYAFVEDRLRLDDFGLIAMDMDSTLITIECIDEIADFAGVKAQVAAVTLAAMRGEIDWGESMRQRVALLAGIDENALESVYRERVVLSRGAEILLNAAHRSDIRLLLVSGGFTFFTDRLRDRLGFDWGFSNRLEIEDGKLTGRVAGDLFDAAAKASAVAGLRDNLGLTRDQLIVIGDGANDLKMMAETNVSIAYRAKPVVREHAAFSLNYSGLDGLLNLFPAYA